MIEIIDALRSLLEPDPDLVDDTAEMPYDWQAEKLYVFEDSSSVALWDTGDMLREDFTLMCVIPKPSGEEAVQERDRDVSVALDQRRLRYLRTIAENPSLAVDGVNLWSYIAASSEPRYLREFELRGIAVRVVGYRLLSVTDLQGA